MEYYKNGDIYRIHEIHSNRKSVYVKEYNVEGELSKEVYIDNEVIQKTNIYSQNRLVSSVEFDSGVEEYKYFDSSGNCIKTINYVNKQKEGLAYSFRPDGLIDVANYFKAGNLVNKKLYYYSNFGDLDSIYNTYFPIVRIESSDTDTIEFTFSFPISELGSDTSEYHVVFDFMDSVDYSYMPYFKFNRKLNNNDVTAAFEMPFENRGGYLVGFLNIDGTEQEPFSLPIISK